MFLCYNKPLFTYGKAKKTGGGGERKEAPFSGNESNTIVPVELSPLETLLQAHPDLTVYKREIFNDVGIIQQLTNSQWRLLDIDVEQEKDGQRFYPTVVISGINTPANTFFTDDLATEQRHYGLTTYVKIYTKDDNQVQVEVEYRRGKTMPSDKHPLYKYYTELHARPIPAYELVSTARSGLEMLEAYRTVPEKERIQSKGKYRGAFSYPRVNADYSRPDFDAYIAEVSPLLARIMQNSGITYNNLDNKTSFALNALRQVTDGMLPTPPPPARRTRPPGQ